jgi:Ca-activated chloride channel family protein
MLYDWFQHIEFAHPWVLYFLALLPLLAFLHYRRKRRAAITVSSAEAFSVTTFRNSLVGLPFLLRLLSLAALIGALARPQVSHVQNRTTGQGIDIVLCMDVSGSMQSSDFYPTRLEVAKQLAADFVKARPVDQIGLVIFSGQSFTQYPLSTDHAGLLNQIQGLKEGLLPDGTVIGEGLATSVDRLSLSKAKSRVIILLTDGKEEAPESRLIDPYTALEIAKAKGVKVYTIGMGAENAAAISETGRKVNRNDAFLDEDLLRRIAVQTGGEYFRAKDKESLQEIYAQIDRMEKTEVQVVTKTRREEQFMYFVLAALAFLALEIILRYAFLRTFP